MSDVLLLSVETNGEANISISLTPHFQRALPGLSHVPHHEDVPQVVRDVRPDGASQGAVRDRGLRPGADVAGASISGANRLPTHQ